MTRLADVGKQCLFAWSSFVESLQFYEWLGLLEFAWVWNSHKFLSLCLFSFMLKPRSHSNALPPWNLWSYNLTLHAMHYHCNSTILPPNQSSTNFYLCDSPSAMFWWFRRHPTKLWKKDECCREIINSYKGCDEREVKRKWIDNEER